MTILIIDKRMDYRTILLGVILILSPWGSPQNPTIYDTEAIFTLSESAYDGTTTLSAFDKELWTLALPPHHESIEVTEKGWVLGSWIDSTGTPLGYLGKRRLFWVSPEGCLVNGEGFNLRPHIPGIHAPNPPWVRKTTIDKRNGVVWALVNRVEDTDMPQVWAYDLEQGHRLSVTTLSQLAQDAEGSTVGYDFFVCCNDEAVVVVYVSIAPSGRPKYASWTCPVTQILTTLPNEAAPDR